MIARGSRLGLLVLLAPMAAMAVIPALAGQAEEPPNATPAQESEPAAQGLHEVFPHVRVDRDKRLVEIDARVPIRLDDPEAPHVYIELIACTPDTREHEVLVVTRAQPSHVHAALLLLGVEPGSPAKWIREGESLKTVAPEGPTVEVRLVHTDAEGREIVSHPADWIVNAKSGEHLSREEWLFAGSRMLTQPGIAPYDADGAGTLIGLCSFGSEVLAWPKVISADSWIDAPVWIADVNQVPPLDTPVTIRLHVPTTPEAESTK